MTFFIMIFTIIAIGLAYIPAMRAIENHNVKKNYGISGSQYRALSWPSQVVMKRYYALPESNRPYGNIYHVLTALDIKAGDGFDKHNTQYGYESSHAGWCSCPEWQQHNCPSTPHKELRNEISRIQSSLEEQQHALQIAGVADGLTQAEQFMEALRQENLLINDTTKELTDGK